MSNFLVEKWDKKKRKRKDEQEEKIKKGEEFLARVYQAENIWGNLSEKDRESLCKEAFGYKFLNVIYNSDYKVPLYIFITLIGLVFFCGFTNHGVMAFVLSLTGFLLTNSYFKKRTFGIKRFWDPASGLIASEFIKQLEKLEDVDEEKNPKE